MHALINRSDWPGLENIKAAKQDERQYEVERSQRNPKHGNPHTDKFIPDNAAMIMHAQALTSFLTKPYTAD